MNIHIKWLFKVRLPSTAMMAKGLLIKASYQLHSRIKFDAIKSSKNVQNVHVLCRHMVLLWLLHIIWTKLFMVSIPVRFCFSDIVLWSISNKKLKHSSFRVYDYRYPFELSSGDRRSGPCFNINIQVCDFSHHDVLFCSIVQNDSSTKLPLTTQVSSLSPGPSPYVTYYLTEA